MKKKCRSYDKKNTRSGKTFWIVPPKLLFKKVSLEEFQKDYPSIDYAIVNKEYFDRIVHFSSHSILGDL